MASAHHAVAVAEPPVLDQPARHQPVLRRPPRRPLGLLAYSWVLFAALAVVSVIRHLGNVAAMPEGLTMGDWRDATFYAIRSILEGDNPYDHEAYLATQPVVHNFPPYTPHHLTLHMPFGFGPIEFAATFWFLVNLALGVWLAWLVVRVARGSVERGTDAWPLVWLVASAILLTDFGQVNQFGGQDGTEMAIGALLLFGGFLHPWVRALGLVFVAQKLNWALPAVLLALALGDRKAVWRGLAITTILSLPTGVAAMIAAGGPFALIEDVRNGLEFEAGVESNSLLSDRLARFDPVATFSRTTNIDVGRVGEVLFLLVVVAVAAFLLQRARRIDQAPALTAAVAMMAFLFAAPHHLYDGVPFVAALALLAVGRIQGTLAGLALATGSVITVVLTLGHYGHTLGKWFDYPHWERAATFGPFLVVVGMLIAAQSFRDAPVSR